MDEDYIIGSYRVPCPVDKLPLGHIEGHPRRTIEGSILDNTFIALEHTTRTTWELLIALKL